MKLENLKEGLPVEITAKQFWKLHFDEYPQNDAEKLAVAMMAEYAHQFKSDLKELREAARELVHLHLCEMEGLQSGKPTPSQWYEAVNKLSDLLHSEQGVQVSDTAEAK